MTITAGDDVSLRRLRIREALKFIALLIIVFESRAALPGQLLNSVNASVVRTIYDEATRDVVKSGSVPGPRWKAGQNYVELEPKQSPPAIGSAIQLVEIFSYTCHACYEFESLLQEFVASKRGLIKFSRVYAVWSLRDPLQIAHARLYYTLRLLGRNDLDRDVLDEIHLKKTLVFFRDSNKTFSVQLKFARDHGVNEAAFSSAYGASTVELQLSQAALEVRSLRVERTPSLVINGKYLSDPVRAGGQRELLELSGYLIDEELRGGDASR